jgi:glycosyltransferase involved in cell wall biosynthesis
MKSEPIITVIMPVFNVEKYIKESVESVLNQTVKDFEFLIYDDCCTDDTIKIIEEFKDDRIIIIRNTENIGLTKSLNKGIEIAKGKFIVRTDGDDICLPDRFERQLKQFERDSELGICGSWFLNFGDRNGVSVYPENHDDIQLGLLFQSQFCHVSVMIKKSVLDQFNLRYNENFITAQDYELWTRITHLTKSYNIPEVLMKCRFHSSSISVIKKEQQLKNRDQIILNQIRLIGFKKEIENIQLFIDFCNSKFDFKLQEIEWLKGFLSELIIENNESKFLKKNSFENFIKEKWFHLCYNMKFNNLNSYSYYRNSSLAKKLNFIDKLKFFLRSKYKRK